MTERSEKNALGVILGIVGGIVTIVVSMILFFTIYEGIVYYNLYERVPLHECRATIGVFFPMFAAFAVIGGVLLIIGAFGFSKKKQWAFPIALIGNVVSLKSSFWPNIPVMESNYGFPWYFVVFAVNLAIYFILTRRNGIPMKRVMLGLIMGMGFILSFINGIAATTRIIMRGNDFYMFSQRLSFTASLCWGLATLGVLLVPKKDWVRAISIGGGILGVISGFTLGFGAIIVFGEPFSMFMLSPFISAALLLLVLLPGLWGKIVTADEIK